MAEVSWEPWWVEIEGGATVLHHVAFKARQALRGTDVARVVVFIIGEIEGILLVQEGAARLTRDTR